MTNLNWAGNLEYSASDRLSPTSIEELQRLVAASSSMRALGSRHSFSTVADTTGTQVQLAGLPGDIVVDADARTVTVPAGARYGDFVEELDRQGFALKNLASLPHISVAGAVATGTHGSGDRNGSLASSVAALELVTADGSLVAVRRGDPDFEGMVVSLGLLGIVTRVTLDVVPRFDMRQEVFETLRWDTLLEHFDEITSARYSVSLFTDWQEPGIRIAWVKSRLDEEPVGEEFFGATRAAREHHPLPDLDAGNTTRQSGVPGPWWDRLPHFTLGFTPSNGEEIQAEYLVPRVNAVEGIQALRGLADLFGPHLFVSEIRTIAADDLWLSTASGADSVGFHFTFKREPEIAGLLPHLDAALAPLGGRPHWGKVFEADPAALAALYPRMDDFRALATRLDPEGKFRNDFVGRWVFGG
jgi:xylitol oxidase